MRFAGYWCNGWATAFWEGPRSAPRLDARRLRAQSTSDRVFREISPYSVVWAPERRVAIGRHRRRCRRCAPGYESRVPGRISGCRRCGRRHTTARHATNHRESFLGTAWALASVRGAAHGPRRRQRGLVVGAERRPPCGRAATPCHDVGSGMSARGGRKTRRVERRVLPSAALSWPGSSASPGRAAAHKSRTTVLHRSTVARLNRNLSHQRLFRTALAN